nr:MAG TPA: virion morphogenesis protein [Caudoviricetes sp.]
MATKNGVALNWGGFDRALSRAGHKLGDTQSLMEVVGETLESSTRQRFEEGKSPEGEPWEPSGRVRATGGKTLNREGDLKKSITSKATPHEVRVGSALPYARIHQKGGTIRPKKGKFLKFRGLNDEEVFVKEVTIPARPYLGVSSEDMEEVRAVMADFLKDAFKAGK